MAGSKYAIQIVQDEAKWAANITRRVSRKTVVVSKTQGEFASEVEAQTWADAELKTFMGTQTTRNKRRNEKR